MLAFRPRTALGQLASAALLALAVALSSAHAGAQEACFERLDTGIDLSGWHPSATNHHGPGSGWTAENGALVGRQTGNQQGGILLTEKSYKDVEVIFQVKIDWGCDSGFFFRTTAGDRAYQVNVDHLAQAGVGTIYGEGFNQELRAIPYFVTDMGNAAVPAPNQPLTPIFDLALWPTLWHPTEFNEIRARVESNPPHMQVWISGTKVMDFTDATTRTEIDATGPLAIQVHGGERWIPGGSVAYKNIRVKDLSVPCNDPGAGGSGGAGAGGSAGAGAGAAGGSGGSAAGASGGGATNAGAPSAAGSASLAGGGGTASGGAPGTAGTSSSGGVVSFPMGPDTVELNGTELPGCSCTTPSPRGSHLVTWLTLVGLVWVGLSRRPAGRRRSGRS